MIQRASQDTARKRRRCGRTPNQTSYAREVTLQTRRNGIDVPEPLRFRCRIEIATDGLLQWCLEISKWFVEREQARGGGFQNEICVATHSQITIPLRIPNIVAVHRKINCNPSLGPWSVCCYRSHYFRVPADAFVGYARRNSLRSFWTVECVLDQITNRMGFHFQFARKFSIRAFSWLKRTSKFRENRCWVQNATVDLRCLMQPSLWWARGRGSWLPSRGPSWPWSSPLSNQQVYRKMNRNFNGSVTLLLQKHATWSWTKRWGFLSTKRTWTSREFSKFTKHDFAEQLSCLIKRSTSVGRKYFGSTRTYLSHGTTWFPCSPQAS